MRDRPGLRFSPERRGGRAGWGWTLAELPDLLTNTVAGAKLREAPKNFDAPALQGRKSFAACRCKQGKSNAASEDARIDE
jgi:hypothetical protein